MVLIKTIISLIVLIASFSIQAQTADTNLLKSHLTAITKTEKFRNYKNIEQLNQTADYIHSIFSEHSENVVFQEYMADGLVYKNVIASFGPANAQRIIVGAHYDVCGDQEGADDNASGVVGILELARLLKGQVLNYRIDLVAYSLEEPPYFRTESMGSYIHAQSLIKDSVKVFGMISVEMIGYFKDEKKSQSLPAGLSLFYGNKGNFIALVKKFGSGKFARQFCKKFKGTNAIRTKKITAPTSLPGVDYSDQLNYWSVGISALMITDTAFLRNKNYHEKSDTMETLDLSRMAKVINGIYETLIGL